MLVFILPYDSSAFSGVAEVILQIHCDALRQIALWMEQYTGSTEPSSSDWKSLDTTLQYPRYSTLKLLVRLARVPVRTPPSQAVAFGDPYPHGDFANKDWESDVREFLPATYKTGAPFLQLWLPTNEGAGYRQLT